MAEAKKKIQSTYKSGKARMTTAFLLFLALLGLLFYFYEANRERVEVFDIDISETNPEIALIDSIDIHIYHSYNSEFSVIGKKDRDNTKQNVYAQKKTPSLSFDVDLSIRKHQTFDEKYHKYYSEWIPIDSTKEVVNLPLHIDPEYGKMTPYVYRYFKEVKCRFFINQRANNFVSPTTITPLSRHTEYMAHSNEGDSLVSITQYLVAYYYKKQITETQAITSKPHVSPLVYEGEKDHYSSEMQYRIRNQSNYNLFLRDINIAIDSCKYKTLTIHFPSSVVCDLITVEPDLKTATSITYNTEKSFHELQENGLFINAKPLSNRNYIESKNFILATIIGGLFSIIADLVITIITERGKRKRGLEEDD